MFKVKLCRVHKQAFVIHVGVQKERYDAFYSQNKEIGEGKSFPLLVYLAQS